MTASNSRLAIVFAAVAFGSGLVLAQDAPAPAANPAPQSSPVSILPQNLTPPSAAPAENDDAAIDVGALEAPSIDRIGLVDVAKGGFPADMWTGSDQASLKILLAQLPRRINSPAERRLAVNFLLSPGAP